MLGLGTKTGVRLMYSGVCMRTQGVGVGVKGVSGGGNLGLQPYHPKDDLYTVCTESDSVEISGMTIRSIVFNVAFESEWSCSAPPTLLVRLPMQPADEPHHEEGWVTVARLCPLPPCGLTHRASVGFSQEHASVDAIQVI